MRLLNERGVTVCHAPHQDLARRIREQADPCDHVDALICDPPYSARTHAGHDGAMAQAYTWDGARRGIPYAAWSDADARAFVRAWSPLVFGWVCIFTDHALAPHFIEALEAADRYAFSPIACVESGSRVRILGDGPAQWSTFLIVARPRSKEWLEGWRAKRKHHGASAALPGAYVIGRSNKEIVGAKPLDLMRAIVRDYSSPGEVIVDPCCGSGTTGLAARLEGRRAIMGDANEEHARIAEERCALGPRSVERQEALPL